MKKEKRNYWKIAFWVLLVLFLWTFLTVGILNKEFKKTDEALLECVDFMEKVYRLEDEGRIIPCDVGEIAYCSLS